MNSLNGTPTFHRSHRWTGLVVTLLALFALVAGQLPTMAEAANTPSRVSGTVTRTGAPVSGAQVVLTIANAPQNAGPNGSNNPVSRSAITDGSGNYALENLPAGTYLLSLRPGPTSTTSPDWIYTGGDVTVAVPPDATQNFAVTPTAATVVGSLALPTGASGDFATPGQRAWVRAENQEGQGNTVLVAADGSFSLKVLAGPVLLSVVLENQAWSPPPGLRGLVYFAEAGATVQVDGDPLTAAIEPLQVVVKSTSLSGTVKIQGDGVAPAGIPVRAWRLDGADYEQTLTHTGGSYSLNLIPGIWLVRALPLESQAPTTAVEPQDYVPAEPPRKVVLTEGASATQDLLIAKVDIVVNGRAVDAANSQPLTTGVNGRVHTLYFDPTTKLPMVGPGANLKDGVFTLKLASTVAVSYSVGLYFPPDMPYTALSRAQLFANNVPTSLDIPVTQDNSHIKGQFKDRSGKAVLGTPGVVWGASDRGGWARAQVNPANGSYDLNVMSTFVTGKGGTTWRVRAYVDPTSGYLVQRPRVQRVFLPYNSGAGSTIEGVDFTLVDLNTLGAINGRVLNARGEPLPRIRVIVNEIISDGTAGLSRWAYTDRNGGFSLRVPPGTYRVSAHDGGPIPPGPLDRLIDPAPVLVTIGAGNTQPVELRYRTPDALVQGRVTYNGQPYPALVRARSSDGASLYVRTGTDGNYKLGLKSGLSWTLSAVSSEANTFLRSEPLVVTPPASTTATTLSDLVLKAAAPLPESQAFVFDAATDQIFTMGDGSQVQVPAGALAPSDSVTLTVRPLPELNATGGVQPISFGYQLHAFDGSRRPITQFLRPVTLVIPFTAAQLTALGITIDQLVPAYWDEASASWTPVETVTVVPDSSGGGTVNIAVEHFTDFALLATAGGTVNLPLVTR